jgi:hypothetical protein
VNHFGEQLGAALLQRRYPGSGDPLWDVGGVDTVHNPTDFYASARLGLPRMPAGLLPVSDPWVLAGIEHVDRIFDSLGQQRLRLRQRLGPVLDTDTLLRGGPDLNAAFNEQVGAVYRVPLRAEIASAVIASGTLRVFGRSRRLVRASEISSDALFGNAEGDAYLPHVDGHPVLQATFSWEELPEVSDLDQGTGRRFVAEARSVRVVLDAPGVYQVFLEP